MHSPLDEPYVKASTHHSPYLEMCWTFERKQTMQKVYLCWSYEAAF